MPRLVSGSQTRRCRFTGKVFDTTNRCDRNKFKKHCLQIRKHNRVWNFCREQLEYYRENFASIVKSCETVQEICQLSTDGNLQMALFFESATLQNPGISRSQFFNLLTLDRSKKRKPLNLQNYRETPWQTSWAEYRIGFIPEESWSFSRVWSDGRVQVPVTFVRYPSWLSTMNYHRSTSRPGRMVWTTYLELNQVHDRIKEMIAFAEVLGDPDYDTRTY